MTEAGSFIFELRDKVGKKITKRIWKRSSRHKERWNTGPSEKACLLD